MPVQRFLPLVATLLAMPVCADDLFFSELPVVASVSRLPQRIADAPASVTVIDRDMIRASGARSLNDIFRLVPGFQTFAHSDTSARVNYHGITDDNDYSPRVQVLIDGRSLHSPLFRNGVNWSLIPVALEDIERIEVVRGTNVVSYGSNAFLGVVNVITVNPVLVWKTSISASNGNQGIRDYSLRTGGQWGDRVNYRFTYQENKDNGLRDRFDWRDSYFNRRLAARIDVQATPNDLLEIDFGKVEGEFTRGRRLPNTDLSEEDNPIRDLNESSTWGQVRWIRALETGEDFSLRYSFSEDRGDDTFFITELPALPTVLQKVNESGDWSHRHELEMVHTFSPVDKTRLVWGGSARYDAVRSETMLRDRGTQSRIIWRGFSNIEWKPTDWLTANLGGASEHDTLSGKNFSPRASLAFHLDRQNTLRFGYSRAWRTSGIVAYRANQLTTDTSILTKGGQMGNRKLPAERLDTWEVAYLGDWRDWRMSLDVRHFKEKMTDRIMKLRPRDIDFPPFNEPSPDWEQSLQNIDIRGHELQWRWQPLESTRLILSHASVKISSELSDEGLAIAEIRSGSSLESVARQVQYQILAENSAPRRSSSFMLMQELPYGLKLSVMRYWVNAIKWTRGTDVDKYNRTDARLAYPFSFAGQRGEIAYTQQSIDGRHAEQRAAGDARDLLKARWVDRRHWVSLRLDF